MPKKPAKANKGRPVRRRASKGANTFPIVGIGASAGGLESLTALLKSLRPDTGMSFVVIQHLGPSSKSQLAELLVRTTSMPVSEIRDGMPVAPNHVYVLPPAYDVLLKKRRLRLVRRPDAERIHMPIDHFFASLAEQEKERAVGVVLSGTGADGTQGLRAIKAENGLSFAESETSAKYFAMPNSAILAGCVDAVRTAKGLARDLAAIATHPYVCAATVDAGGEVALQGFPEGADALSKIFYLIKQQTGVNFSEYKHTTLRRRIARRMVLHHFDNLDEYVKHLRKTPGEVEQLFHDILINVTSFFRDRSAFATLQKKILPRILKARGPHGEVRIWVAGCATGEEIYSLAMCAVEALGSGTHAARIQLFGTDLSEQLVTRARAGVYPQSIAADVSPARLRRFFTKTANGRYQVSRLIRDMCTFARQNVCEDPPFSRLDIITCRNVLIYLGPQLQRKCIPVFHYALNAGGYLMLGSSETVGGFADLFALVDKKNKIYVKRETALRPSLDFNSKQMTSVPIEPQKSSPPPARDGEPGSDLQRQVDRLILARFLHSGVVVDEDLTVLQFRGATSRYLEHAAGAASLHLLQMVRPALIVELRAAMHRAMKDNVAVRRENIPLEVNGETLLIHIEVAPFSSEAGRERLFFVTFEESKAAGPDGEPPGKAGVLKPPTRAGAMELKRTRDELNSTKESLQAIIEEREAANEELKWANEEIQSSNEELQSTNEELETAKEELQSANEELTTVNEELGNRNLELATLNNDLNNLLSSINIPITIVDNDLRVRRVTSPGEKIFNLIPSDIGRPLSNIKPNLDVPDLVPLIREVIETLTIREREVRDTEGRWHQLRIRPYRTVDNKIDGAVITLVEIDVMKRSMAELQNVIEFAHAILDTAREPMLVLDDKLAVKQANRAFRERFKIARVDLENAKVDKLGDGWNMPRLRPWLKDVLEKQQRTGDLQLQHHFPMLGTLQLSFQARRLGTAGDQVLVLTVRDASAAGEEGDGA